MTMSTLQAVTNLALLPFWTVLVVCREDRGLFAR